MRDTMRGASFVELEAVDSGPDFSLRQSQLLVFLNPSVCQRLIMLSDSTNDHERGGIPGVTLR